MPKIYLFSLWTALALLLAVANLGKSPEWFDDLVLAGYVFLFG